MALERCFVFLQGPHGPFFDELSGALQAAGCRTLRVGFNAGDAKYWSHKESYLPYLGPAEGWPVFLNDLIVGPGFSQVGLMVGPRCQGSN